MRNQSQSVVLEPPSVTKHEVKNRYVEALTLIERLHRRLLDVIKTSSSVRAPGSQCRPGVAACSISAMPN